MPLLRFIFAMQNLVGKVSTKYLPANELVKRRGLVKLPLVMDWRHLLLQLVALPVEPWRSRSFSSLTFSGRVFSISAGREEVFGRKEATSRSR